jgi:serine/threonine protein phosphatase PrpC
MSIDIHAADCVGERSEQQDCAASVRLNDGADGSLLVLADGVGGQAGGAIASRIAVDALLGAARAGALDEPAKQRPALATALEKANRLVGEKARANPKLAGMATTLVAAIVSPHSLKWVSVGDSHLYLFRDGALRKLNEDHSLAHLMVKSGTYKVGDPALDEYRNVIASAVSGGEIKHIDLPGKPVGLRGGDIVLLASDGLDTLPRERIQALVGELANATSRKIADILLSAVTAERRPRQDNTTVLVACIGNTAARRRASPTLAPGRTQPAIQATAGSKWVLSALLLTAITAGATWWYLRTSMQEGAAPETLMSEPARDKSEKAALAIPEPHQRQSGERPALTPRQPTAVGTRRVVPQSLQMFDCQIRVQNQTGQPLSLPDYCRRFFGGRSDIRYF